MEQDPFYSNIVNDLHKSHVLSHILGFSKMSGMTLGYYHPKFYLQTCKRVAYIFIFSKVAVILKLVDLKCY